MALDYVPLIDDKIVIELEDVQEEIEFWGTTLVGTVLGRRVSLAQLNSLVHKHWNHVSPPNVLYFSRGWFYFRFDTVEDMHTILHGPAWNLNGYPLLFKPWSPTVSHDIEAVSLVPAWVLFPNLDPYLWSAKALSKLASSIGRPICADEPTTNKTKVSFARLLIEVDVSKDLPGAVTVTTPYGPRIQKVQYEWLPYYCSHCKRLGHQLASCRFQKKVYKPKPPAPTEAVSEPLIVEQPAVEKSAEKVSTPSSILETTGFQLVRSKSKHVTGGLGDSLSTVNRFSALAPPGLTLTPLALFPEGNPADPGEGGPVQ
ncbi:hypothetical protein vseg_020992 [Gypsophila vaccaria]